VNFDWHRYKAVVLESDDWGLCAWSPDESAHRVLAGTPAFRSAAGARYGRSTLESAADVRALRELLLEFRGGDGFAPVWQANTVMASPDYARLKPPGFEAETLPLAFYPNFPGRWQRPGMWDEVEAADAAGVWWAELHGLHHLPAHAWLTALRRGEDDARQAHGQLSPICRAVEASGEYDASEPAEWRTSDVIAAIGAFTHVFRRPPTSFCPPDYRWDGQLEADAGRLGVTTFQGRAERAGAPLPGVQRLVHRYRWPHREGDRFYLPPRIAFEPRGDARALALGVEVTLRAVQATWERGQPAVVSTHRLNYAHLDAAWSAAGREALHELLEGLAKAGAMFVTDAEIRQLVTSGWSVRPLGTRGALLRFHAASGQDVRFASPPDVLGARVTETRATKPAAIDVADGEVTARVDVGEHVIEWRRA
jgi:hypothetical protein